MVFVVALRVLGGASATSEHAASTSPVISGGEGRAAPESGATPVAQEGALSLDASASSSAGEASSAPGEPTSTSAPASPEADDDNTGAAPAANRTGGDLERFSEMSLEELLSCQLKTGSFLELDLKRSPETLTIITREQIALSGARHLGELLEIYIPGFVYQ